MRKPVFTFLLAATSFTCYSQYAPETGGTGYIQNQSAANQAASFRINGTAYINTNPAAYTNTLRGFVESANYRSGLIMESTGSINYGVTGADASGFAFRWLNANSTTIDYATNTQEIMRLSKTGNLGIGTASPGYKLDVNGNARFLNSLYVGSGIYYGDVNNLAFFHNGGYIWANIGNTTTRMSLSSAGDLSVGGTLLTVGGKQVWHAGNFTPSGYLSLAGGGTITANVSIGTTPDQKDLAVNGTIKTRKLTVTQTNWPDYVFDSSYKLVTLQQVEHYIQTNKHLPDVPSATAVSKEGIDVGANQALLLKKIEELTLYIIQQSKEIQQLKQEMTQQKEQMKAITR